MKGKDNCAVDTLLCTSFQAEMAASAPYPSDNCDTVGMVLGMRLSAFRCAHVMTKPETLPPPIEEIAVMLTISTHEELLNTIQLYYADYNWCTQLLKAAFLPHGVRKVDGLL